MIYEYLAGLFTGSPKTSTNKPKPDGNIETYADIGKKTRKEIAYHYLNGTDIPAMINTATTGIIGEGISIQSRTKKEMIDVEFENLIKEHSKKRNFEVTKKYSRDDALIMAISEKMRKGGILVRHRYSNKWEIPYRLQLIGVDMIDVNKFNKEKNIINGLRKDKDGAIEGYYIFTDSTKTRSVEIPASEISSYMDLWMDVSQYSAVARLSQMLPELDGLLEYQRNELEAASERTKGSVFWHTKMYDSVIDAMNELYRNLKTKKHFGDNAVKNQEYFAELTEIQRTVMKQIEADGVVPAGGMKAVGADDKISQVSTNTSSVFEPFSENSLNKITSSQNRSRVITYKNMKNTNWATINALSSIDEKQNSTEMRMIKEHILDEYLERLFQVGVETKRISISLEEYLKNKSSYHKWEVLRQSRVVTDESKLATSTKINLETGATTLEESYRKRGKDYKTEMLKQVQTEIELEKEKRAMYKDAGIPYPEDQNKEQDNEG